MATVNQPSLKFSKMSEKMSEKWKSILFGTLAALNSACHCRPCQGGVGIIILDQGPVGWLGPQAVKKKLEPQIFRPKTA